MYIRACFCFPYVYKFFCNFKLALCLLALCLRLLPELYSSQSSYYNYLLGGNFLVVKRSITHLPQSVLCAHSWCLVSHPNCLSQDFLLMFMFFVVDWSFRQIYGIPQGFLYQALCWRCDVSDRLLFQFVILKWYFILTFLVLVSKVHRCSYTKQSFPCLADIQLLIFLTKTKIICIKISSDFFTTGVVLMLWISLHHLSAW